MGRPKVGARWAGECHIAKQCTKPKRKRDDTWFNDKVLLVQAQASGQALTEEEIAFLADPGLPDVQNSQSVITYNAAYEVHNQDNLNYDLFHQSEQIMTSSEQSNASDTTTVVRTFVTAGTMI
ncbi:hypothetical protein Tco_0337542 [Tanacetum coccineum]